MSQHFDSTLPFSPETIDDARSRFAEALVDPYDVEFCARGTLRRPTQSRRNTFDFRQGRYCLRLSVFRIADSPGVDWVIACYVFTNPGEVWSHTNDAVRTTRFFYKQIGGEAQLSRLAVHAHETHTTIRGNDRVAAVRVVEMKGETR